MIGWLAGSLVGWLVHWVDGGSTDCWLVNSLVPWLIAYFTGYLVNYGAVWLAD